MESTSRTINEIFPELQQLIDGDEKEIRFGNGVIARRRDSAIQIEGVSKTFYGAKAAAPIVARMVR